CPRPTQIVHCNDSHGFGLLSKLFFTFSHRNKTHRILKIVRGVKRVREKIIVKNCPTVKGIQSLCETYVYVLSESVALMARAFDSTNRANNAKLKSSASDPFFVTGLNFIINRS